MAVPIMFQPLVKYADFSGRARRSEFWLFWLFRQLAVYGLWIILALFVPATAYNPQHPEAYMSAMMPLSGLINLFGLAMFIPSLAVSVRRLHDTNRSGWWLLLPFGGLVIGVIIAIVMIGSNIGSMKNTHDVAAIMAIMGGVLLALIPWMIGGLILFIFNLLDGTPGTNRFGPDPKSRGDNAAAVF